VGVAGDFNTTHPLQDMRQVAGKLSDAAEASHLIYPVSWNSNGPALWRLDWPSCCCGCGRSGLVWPRTSTGSAPSGWAWPVWRCCSAPCPRCSAGALLAGLDTRLDLATAGKVYFVGGLGKYVPGGLWPMLTQADLARRLGEPPIRFAEPNGLRSAFTPTVICTLYTETVCCPMSRSVRSTLPVL
jgi:hypothetical protein